MLETKSADDIRMVIARSVVREFLDFIPLAILVESFQCFEGSSRTKSLYPKDFDAIKEIVGNNVRDFDVIKEIDGNNVRFD